MKCAKKTYKKIIWMAIFGHIQAKNLMFVAKDIWAEAIEKKRVLIHTSDKSHVYKIWNKEFSQKSNSKKLILTQTDEKPHVCKMYNKRFLRNDKLKLHCRFHLGEKPHVCDICNKEFSKDGHLNDHLQAHKFKNLIDVKCARKSF